MAFHDDPQVLERVELYLADALSRYTYFFTDLFERRSPVAMQTETAFDDSALLLSKFRHPAINEIFDAVLLSTPGGLGASSRLEPVHRPVLVFLVAGTNRHTIVQ